MRHFATWVKHRRPSPLQWRPNASFRSNSSSATASVNDKVTDRTSPSVATDEQRNSSLFRISLSRSLDISQTNGSQARSLATLPLVTSRESSREYRHRTTLSKLQSLRARLNASPLSRLWTLLEETPEDIQQAWAIIGSIRSIPEETGNKVFRPSSQHLATLYLETVKQWLQKREPGLPSPSQAASILDGIVKLSGTVLHDTMWTLLIKLLQQPGDDQKFHNPDEVEKEILRLWHYAIHRYEEKLHDITMAKKDLELTWPTISSRNFRDLKKGDQNFRTESFRLFSLWPNIPENERGELFTLAVAIFSHIVTHGLHQLAGDTKVSAIFLAGLLYKSNTWDHQQQILQRITSEDLPVNTGIQFRQALHDIHYHTLIVMMASQPPPTGVVKDSGHLTAELNLQDYFFKSLGRMHERGIYSSYKQTWNLAHGTFRVLSTHIKHNSRPTKQQSTHLPNRLYRMFLLTAFRMNNVKTAMRIWTHMVSDKNNILQLEDWTTMISGIGATQDMKAVDVLWQQMLQSGIKPDIPAWNARIKASINCGNFGYGISLVNDISNQWASKLATSKLERKEVLPHDQEIADGQHTRPAVGLDVMKPTTRTLNTILSAIRNTNPQNIPDILKWAESMGIESDTYTFNILLSNHKEQDDEAAFLKAFNEMLVQQVTPDVVTYNLLNRFALDKSHKSVKETRGTFLQVIESMIEHGFEPTSRTYGPMVQELLSQGAVDDAKLLLEHSKQFGRSVHARLCAVMAKGILEHRLPDLSIINAMRDEMMMADAGIGSDFYNAVLYGLAKSGRRNQMLAYMETARKIGASPTWTTLLTCLKACAYPVRRRAAQKVLDYASQSVGRGIMEINGSAKQDAKEHRDLFWKLVIQLDLGLEIRSGDHRQ
jgi:pentatricopeptide repeat protein